MDNRGKLWSIDDDQKLMENPHFSNSYFAQTMGRSENAIKCRRSHIAAKMQQNDPSVSLEECVVLMHADYAQTSELLIEWSQRRATIKSCLESSRKRKLAPHASNNNQQAAMGVSSCPFPLTPCVSSIPQAAGSAAASSTFSTATTTCPGEDERITFICKRICDDGGNLNPLWNIPHLLPTLVKHYQGFKAYSDMVTVLAATYQ
jgi:hypothetical protein